MKDKKYYIPEIEEFHVGFEYQETYRDRNNLGWIDSIYKTTDNINRFFELNIPKENTIDGILRVKYLDKEDIESLGFKLSLIESSIFLFKEKIRLFPHLEKTTIGINFNGLNSQILIFNIPDENKIPAGINLFIGNIKNKSELKILLKQLNII